jgi:hypothetical protein
MAGTFSRSFEGALNFLNGHSISLRFASAARASKRGPRERYNSVARMRDGGPSGDSLNRQSEKSLERQTCAQVLLLATQTNRNQMKQVLISLATVGLLLGSSAAYSQNTERSQNGTTTSPSTSQSQSAPDTERRSGASNDGAGQRRAGTSTDVNRDRRGGRSNVNVRVHIGGDGYRYRHHHRGVGVYAGAGCRTIIVKRWHHGHRVIKRIRRCG